MITAIILTKNEEKNIEECIQALTFCSEIIVVDDNSTDKTREIASENNAKVFIRNLGNNFSGQRNFALEKAKEEWVLFVDADERISESLAYEISNVITHNIDGFSGFLIPRVDSIWNKQLTHGENKIYLLRLGKKNKGEWMGSVHEQWKIKGRIGKLKNPMIHYPHQTMKDFLREINYYTTIRSKELYSQNKKTHFALIFIYPFGKFFYNYFFRLGILDGVEGLIFVLLMSFHSFLVRSKLWLLWQK